MPAYHYYQVVGGEESWKPVMVSQVDKLKEEKHPVFVTILSVGKMPEELEYEEKLKVKYAGPLYFDWDAADIADTIPKVNQVLDNLAEMGLDLDTTGLYATGGKGFHLEIPEVCFMSKVPKDGVMSLPTIYREMALELFVDTMDMRVYSQGRGRMWREPNVLRTNGRYKVPVSVEEVRGMTVEMYAELTSAPRKSPQVYYPELCLDLSILYERCAQRVNEKMKKRLKMKHDPLAIQRAASPSIGLAMMGQGLKPGVGFNVIAMQLGVAAAAAAVPLETYLENCAGLIENHTGDGSRYNTPGKRRFELARMYQYVEGNPCYDFSIGAMKSILSHTAPDLDGIEVSKEDLQDEIKEAASENASEVDEYADVAGGVSLSKFGAYADTEGGGKKRICAVSFANTTLLRSSDTGDLSGYQTDLLVNGKFHGRQMLETDTFLTPQNFNKICARVGHAFQGTDGQLKALFMRMVEQAKKKGNTKFIVKREGLDVVCIPGHALPEAREPFMIWADGSGVEMEARMQGLGIDLSYQGFPDPRGLYQIDLGNAPELLGWLDDPENKASLKETLTNLMTCQRPEALGKFIGFYTACYWKQLFQKSYGQFPLLHVVGGAGAGKTAMNTAMLSMFYYNAEPKTLTPGSTAFGIVQHICASASVPMVLDEYKPHEMTGDLHNKLKLTLRDAYNSRAIVKGGGNRDHEDYRAISFTELSAPVVFIAEAAETETALLERVVLLTLVRPAASVAMDWLARFHIFRRNRNQLAILGQRFAAGILDGSLAEFRAEFDVMYAEAVDKYMLSPSDVTNGISEAELKAKTNAKERSVYCHTVALFGFKKFRQLVNQIFAGELDGIMQGLEEGMYSRMSDLSVSTMPEYVKVLSMFSTMSHHVEKDRTEALRENHEYAFVNYGDRDCIELSVRACYLKYRAYCKSVSSPALFSGHDAFAYALKDAPALLKQGVGVGLQTPGVFTMDYEELQRSGVEPFKI